MVTSGSSSERSRPSGIRRDTPQARPLTLAEINPVIKEEELAVLIQQRSDLGRLAGDMARRLGQEKPDLLEHYGDEASLSHALQVLAESNRERLELLRSKESFMVKVLKAPGRAALATLKFMWNHPYVTATAAVGLFLFGPYLYLKGASAAEGLLAQVPTNKIMNFFRSGIGLSGSNIAPRIPETLPGFPSF